MRLYQAITIFRVPITQNVVMVTAGLWILLGSAVLGLYALVTSRKRDDVDVDRLSVDTRERVRDSLARAREQQLRAASVSKRVS